MVIFYSYIKLPEGIQQCTVALRYRTPEWLRWSTGRRFSPKRVIVVRSSQHHGTCFFGSADVASFDLPALKKGADDCDHGPAAGLKRLNGAWFQWVSSCQSTSELLCGNWFSVFFKDCLFAWFHLAAPFLPDWLLCLCGFLTKQNGRTDAGLILIVQREWWPALSSSAMLLLP